MDLGDLLKIETLKSSEVNMLIYEAYLPVKKSIEGLQKNNLYYIVEDVEKFSIGSNLNIMKNSNETLRNQKEALTLFISSTVKYLKLFVDTKKDEEVEEWVLETLLSNLLNRALKEYVTIGMKIDELEDI